MPWKSGPQEELDYKIPVGATLVSAAGIVIVAPIASTFINGTDSYVQTVLMNINPNLILPIMLLLTIRVAMKKKTAPKVPQGLMFYENGIQEECHPNQIPQGLHFHEENEESQNEVQDQDQEQNLDNVQASLGTYQDKTYLNKASLKMTYKDPNNNMQMKIGSWFK